MRELFDAALDQPVETRQQFLADACNGDQKLFETVQRLLSANQRGAGVLDTPVFRRLELEPTANEPGSFIGPYKILRELGGGGMGIVYQVVRADEVFQRVFALKLIRPELSSDWLLERFRQERRILGRLDHLNIARIVDGGSTTEGLPYFVMDFVDGPSISHFCTQHALSIRPRVVLFQQVCAAVQYLHGNGVIHGDLKPPNILIGIDGAAKLVDFGIASVLASPLVAQLPAGWKIRSDVNGTDAPMARASQAQRLDKEDEISCRHCARVACRLRDSSIATGARLARASRN
jgi:serine/threonine-protein kinase